MISFNLRPHCKLNLWINDIPELVFNTVNFREICIPPKTSTSRECAQVAAELYMQAGARTHYGLLVGEFVPTESNVLKVSVATSDEEPNTVINWALGSNIDQIYPGLPAQYAESIINGAIDMQPQVLFGAGCINFHRGAHGFVSSSSDIFRRITRLIVFALACQDEIPTQSKMLELLELN